MYGKFRATLANLILNLRVRMQFLFCHRDFQPANTLSLDLHPRFAGHADAVIALIALAVKGNAQCEFGGQVSTAN
jgi:hypothetical protein